MFKDFSFWVLKYNICTQQAQNFMQSWVNRMFFFLDRLNIKWSSKNVQLQKTPKLPSWSADFMKNAKISYRKSFLPKIFWWSCFQNALLKNKTIEIRNKSNRDSFFFLSKCTLWVFFCRRVVFAGHWKSSCLKKN